MDRLLYTAAAGARATLQRQDGLANNLANASTPGFRADRVLFRAVPVPGDGIATRVAPLEATAGYDARSGPIVQTGRALDVAVLGNGWIAVSAPDGEAYTRAGSLQLDAQGTLLSAGGLPVNGEGGPITVPAGRAVEIAADGTVSAVAPGAPPETVGRIKRVAPDAANLVKGGDGLMRLAGGGEAPAAPEVRLAPGALEGSNVNAIDALVGMIAIARQFDTQMKLLQTAEQNDQRAAQLLGPAR